MSAAAMLAQASIASASLAVAQPTTNDTFITLGTMGGPITSPDRSQPANVLLHGGKAYLIDAGDGAAQQLGKAGVPLANLRAIFLSHLHFDHTGGVAAVLGLRYQTNAPGVLTIYGPPGTKALIDGIVASMQPASEAGFGLPGEPRVDPKDTVAVVEMVDGSTASLDRFSITAAQNSHYSFPPGSAEDRRFKSLAFRFELKDRVIVFTGDTGPSVSVERLAQGADLLVSEMIDVQATVEKIRRMRPDLPEAALQGIVKHITDHHLTPVQVGDLASRAKVKKVVVTHLAPGTTSPADIDRYIKDIERRFNGPAAIANDLDRY